MEFRLVAASGQGRVRMSHGGWKRSEPWRDRFRTPSVCELERASSRSAAAIMRAVRDAVLSDTGSTESVRWLGIPWRWTLAFTRCGTAEPWLFLIANPDAPRLAAALPAELAECLAHACAVKSVREGAATARVVGDTAWAEWPVDNVAHARMVLRAIVDAHAAAGVGA